MIFQPSDFNYIDPNWKKLDASLFNFEVDESIPKELGYGGRQYQTDCYNAFENKSQTLCIAPTGSGKSLIQVYCAAREILNSNYKQKQVFVVPQLNIAAGFTQYRHKKIKLNGNEYYWEISTNCCDHEKPVEEISKFLLDKTSSHKSKKSNKVIGGCTAVVSYSALLAAFNRMTPEDKLKAILSTSFRIDETHHISGVNDTDDSNELGEFCKFVLDEGGSLHLTTATFFRGDQCEILDNEYLKGFEKFRVPFLDHWKTLNIKELQQNYVSYKDGEDLLNQLLTSIGAEPNEPPIVIVPSEGIKFFKDNDKIKWVKRLVKGLKKIFGDGKVLDLVSFETQKKDKLRLTDDNQDFSAVVTCQIGREGTDWPICSRVYNTVLDNNVLQPIQKLGRALRYGDKKVDVKMFNYIRYFKAWDDDKSLVRDSLSDRFNAIILASIHNDNFYPIEMAKLPFDREGKQTLTSKKQVLLQDVYGNAYSDVIKSITESFLMLPVDKRDSVSIDKIIDSVIEEYKEDILENVSKDDLKDRFRVEVVRMLNLNNPNLVISGIDVSFIRENGWDKVVREHVLGRSPFGGSMNTKDLEEFQKLFVNSAVENKKKLIEMAKNGEDKPNWKLSLYNALSSYIRKSHDCYDEVFDKEIRLLAPKWFINTATENKKKLLELAKNGEDRPIQKKHPLGKVLGSYICKTSSSYDEVFDKEIHELAPKWFVDTADENKKKLLEMAKKDENRPIYGKHPLGEVLGSYIRKSHDCYDEVFDKEIRLLAPKWFINTATENKKQLLEMAKSGKDRPIRGKHFLGEVLKNYTNKASRSYDEEFSEEIRLLVPKWFINTATENKKRLIEMAKNGEDRPHYKERPLGQALVSYINKSHHCYDGSFNKKIRELAPKWFINIINDNKNKLLEMAKKDENRPIRGKHFLGGILKNYTNKASGSYDEDFDKEIRLLRPNWFINSADENKKKLLELAKNGEDRPIQKKHPLGSVLCSYTNKNGDCYNEDFDKEIRLLRPDWFINSSVDNKKKLLKMAKDSNEKRPNQRNHPLGSVLCNYINKSSSSYDEEFDKEIRKLRPDWFVNTAIDNKKKLLELAKDSNEKRPNKRQHPLGRALSNYISKLSDCYDEGFDKEIRKLRPDWFIKNKSVLSQ